MTLIAPPKSAGLLHPEPFRVQIDRLHLDARAASLGRQHLHGFRPVRVFQGGTLGEQGEDFLGVHGGFSTVRPQKSPDDTQEWA